MADPTQKAQNDERARQGQARHEKRRLDAMYAQPTQTYFDAQGRKVAAPPMPQQQQVQPQMPQLPPGFVQPAGLSAGSFVRQGTYLPASAWRGPNEMAADVGPYEDPRMGGGAQLNPIISAILGMR